MKDEIFYIYVDKTNDGRVFYVGKGKATRIKDVTGRSDRWKFIATKHGHNREVILGTRDETFAFEIEKTLITEYKTFEAKWAKGEGWGANFTAGGDGHSGRTGELAARWGKMHTDETKAKISLTNAGKRNPMFGMSGEASPNFGSKKTNETKAKMIESRLRLITSDEKNNVSKLKINQVLEIREKYAIGNLTQKEMGKEYNVSRECISRIIRGINWAHTLNENNKLQLPTSEQKRNRMSYKGENSSQAILTEKQVIEIRQKYLTSEYSQTSLSKEYGVGRTTIVNVVTGKSWKHLLKQEKVM